MLGLFKKDKEKTKNISQNLTVLSPVKGEVIDIKDTKDEMFNSEMLGKGVGIIAAEKTLAAPVSGTITTFFPTKHAVGICTAEGLEVLIHVGVDTVELNGECFESLKKQGDVVNAGEPILNVDFLGIQNKGYDPTVMLVITNSQEYTNIINYPGQKDVGDTIINVNK